jgi:hypothetical protein
MSFSEILIEYILSIFLFNKDSYFNSKFADRGLIKVKINKPNIKTNKAIGLKISKIEYPIFSHCYQLIIIN